MAKRKTLAETTAEEIIQIIQRNGYEPGQKLPTEKEMTGFLNVGRNTLREALRILQSANVVTIRQGSGTYISDKYGMPEDPLGLDQFQDDEKVSRDVLTALLVIEPEAAALAAQNRTESDLSRLKDLYEDMSQKAEHSGECVDEECRFCEYLAEATHNIVMERLAPVMVKGIRLFAAALSTREILAGVKDYAAVFEGIRRRKAARAKSAVTSHLLYLDKAYRKLQKQTA